MELKKLSKKQLKKAQRINLLAWILFNGIKNENGDPIEFSKHRFMLDLYGDLSATQVVMKGAQVGASTMEILKMFHAAKFQGINQIYTLPTQTDRNEFIQSKVNPIIKKNPAIHEAMGPGDADSVARKQIGSGFVYFKGTHTESEAIMISSDRNIHDEVDKSKPSVIQDYSSRLGYTDEDDRKEQHFFSTPTDPGVGIHQHWQNSDQKHWRFDCPHCGYRQHMEWEKNLDREHVRYMCKKCHKKITPQYIAREGEWEARYPLRENSGYWIPRTICPWEDAQSLMEEEKSVKEEEEKDEKYFYNFVLGKPYLESEDKVAEQYFLKNRVDEDIETTERTIMGMDTGKTNFALIGNEEGIFWAKELEDRKDEDRWEQIREFIEFFDVRTAVVDGLPHTNRAEKLAQDYPYRVYLNFFTDKPENLNVVEYGDEQDPRPEEFKERIKVKSSRNRVYDDLLSTIRSGDIKFAFDENSSVFQRIIEHAKNVYATKEEDRYGQVQRVWENSGADHFYSALIYWYIAYRKEQKNEPNT